MRFKPPPVNSNIGWRVEFRPTEVRKKKIFFSCLNQIYFSIVAND
jgi:hypothetical protein